MKIVRRKIWNEHIKLTATLINAIAIGLVGVAVIGPLTQPENPFYGWDGTANAKLAGLNGSELTTPSPFAVIEWSVVGLAFFIHAVAHIILRGQVEDD